MSLRNDRLFWGILAFIYLYWDHVWVAEYCLLFLLFHFEQGLMVYKALSTAISYYYCAATLLSALSYLMHYMNMWLYIYTNTILVYVGMMFFTLCRIFLSNSRGLLSLCHIPLQKITLLYEEKVSFICNYKVDMLFVSCVIMIYIIGNWDFLKYVI